METLVRRGVAVVALAVLPVGAAACGGSKQSVPPTTTTAVNPGPAVRDAVAKTVKAGSEHAAISAAVTASGRHLQLTGTGDFDSAKRVGSLHASFALGGLQSSLDEVLKGQTIYLTSPLFSAVLPASKKWLKVDLATAGATLGADASVLAAQDPASALAQAKALTGLRRVGTATVDGVETTRYRGRINVSKLPPASRTLVRQSNATFGPVDVWVGADGYVHRLRVTSGAGGGGQKAQTTVTMTLSDFGATVNVTVPPASETVDASTVTIPGLGG